MSNADAQYATGQEALEAFSAAAAAAAAYTVYGGGDDLIVLRSKCPVLPGEQDDDGVRAVAAIDVLRYLVAEYEELHSPWIGRVLSAVYEWTDQEFEQAFGFKRNEEDS